jgi:uncharacterized protein YoxC
LDANVLNLIVIISLVSFAVALGALVFALNSLVPQVNKTLGAYERLAGTLEEELAPTLREVNKVVIGITELKTIAVKNVNEVSTKVEDVTEGITKAADSAKRNSSVWGAGFLAAARAYLDGAGKPSDIKARQDGKQVIRAEASES